MKRYFRIVAWVLVSLVAVSTLSCASAPGPAPKATKAAEPMTIAFYTGPFGTPGYILGQLLEEASQKDARIRILSREAAGGSWGLQHMLETPADWPSTIFNCNPIIQWIAKEGGSRDFEKPRPEAADYRVVFNFTVVTVHFVTLDPNIKTVSDLAGKDIAVGTKAQVGHNLLPTTVLEKGMGVRANVHALGVDKAVEALLDGKVKAASVGVNWAADLKQFSPAAPYVNLQASGKKSYHVDWTKGVNDGMKKAMPGAGLVRTIPANSLANQPQPLTAIGQTVDYSAHKTLPDEAAYLTAKLFLDNYRDWYQRHQQFKLVTPELMVFGLENQRDLIHPGALRAFKEYGVLK